MDLLPHFFNGSRQALFFAMLAVGLAAYGVNRCVRLVRSRV